MYMYVFRVTCVYIISELTSWYWISNRGLISREDYSLSIPWLPIVLGVGPCEVFLLSMLARLLTLYLFRYCFGNHIAEVPQVKVS